VRSAASAAGASAGRVIAPVAAATAFAVATHPTVRSLAFFTMATFAIARFNHFVCIRLYFKLIKYKI
jgi:hypothetical protein